jgi:E3 ubiquitin-protein ligase TRIP12
MVEDFNSVHSAELTPRSVGSKALATMLQLISAFHNVCEYLHNSQGPLMVEHGADATDVTDDGTFHCNSLTSALLRQLSDPLAVCTGSVPPWCTKLTGACRFLFPYSVRRILHHSCNLGLSRALHHLQQRALAQHAHSQETQRRLEGEVAVASIPRQKVRISRQRILESAVKVMNLYGAGSAILEVEYVGEVGTGSGPTLEFYAQVAEILRTSEPKLFRSGVPCGMLFPEPWDPEWLRKGEDQAAQQILERFRLLGHVVAKCILDNRLVDVQLHPCFWRAVLDSGPFSQRSLRDLEPELFSRISGLKAMDADALEGLCVDFTLPGHPEIELKPGGSNVTLSGANVEEYVSKLAEVSLDTACAPQVLAFRTAFRELLPLEACQIWSEKELASIIAGASVRDDACWTLEHLGGHIKAQHGYTGDSRCFRDLLGAMAEFPPTDRKRFLTFVTGAPTLPIGGFAGLKPPLTVVKKEAPPAPLTPDQFMPSVMTCANYLKLPEYSSAEILRQKLEVAMREGQSAFLLS